MLFFSRIIIRTCILVRSERSYKQPGLQDTTVVWKSSLRPIFFARMAEKMIPVVLQITRINSSVTCCRVGGTTIFISVRDGGSLVTRFLR